VGQSIVSAPAMPLPITKIAGPRLVGLFP
jgi:hypothetical protein